MRFLDWIFERVFWHRLSIPGGSTPIFSDYPEVENEPPGGGG